MGEKMSVTCGIFLVDGKDRLLVVHPTGHNDYCWGIPKGLKESNETAWQTAKRELKEETGIDLDSLQYQYDYMGMIPYKYKNKKLLSFYVKCDNILSTKVMRCDSTFFDKMGNKIQEVDRFELVNKDIAVQAIQEEQRKIWEEYWNV